MPPPQVLLIENDINTNPFTPAVHACVPPLPWAVSEADVGDPSRWGRCFVSCICHCAYFMCRAVMHPPQHVAARLACYFAAALSTLPSQRPCITLLAATAASTFPPPSCRADLRHLPVCSVDPPGCKDIDDALHVRRLPNGNYELGVRHYGFRVVVGSGYIVRCMWRRLPLPAACWLPDLVVAGAAAAAALQLRTNCHLM